MNHAQLNRELIFVMDHFHPLTGGAENMMLNLARTLEARSLKVTILTRSFCGLAKTEMLGEIAIHRLSTPVVFSSSSPLARIRLKANCLLFLIAAYRFIARRSDSIVVTHCGISGLEAFKYPLLLALLGRFYPSVECIIIPWQKKWSSREWSTSEGITVPRDWKRSFALRRTLSFVSQHASLFVRPVEKYRE